MIAERFGAHESDWDHFDLILGLGQDLLPVVSNPNATISPQSKMQALGKTPSRYNGQRLVAGISDWTSRITTPADIAKWQQEPDLGICVQTRTVRAIDVDVDDPKQAEEIQDAVLGHLDLPLPIRTRENAAKLLLAVSLPGDMPKRVIKTSHGIIEFLATGQQFIAVGTHPSGAPYRWLGGLPSEIPAITPEQFESLWSMLEEKFAIEPSTTAKASVANKLEEAAKNDPVAVSLTDLGLVRSTERDGRLHIRCPFEAEHTSDSAESATTYFPAFTGGFQQGHFRCLHSHCESRSDADFLSAIGLAPDFADDFDAIVDIGETDNVKISVRRFTPVPDSEFKAGRHPGWLIKNVLPKAELGVVYGPSGSGKSFLLLDMVGAIARGVDWCGKATRKTGVVYVVAEGASGFRGRIQAYCEAHGIDSMGIHIIAAAPNFMEGKDVIELTNEIRALHDIGLVVIDTLAQVSAGANENSGEDMGRVLGHCGTLNRVTNAMVLLVHHSGKDAARGARGWSGIKAGLNVEIEITRCDHNRTATVTKMRDGEGEGNQFGFKLRTVPVGMDEDGDVISSCVVDHGVVVPPRVKEKPMNEHEVTVWSVMLDMQKLGGESLKEVAVVDAAVAATAYEPGTGRDRRKRDIDRALRSLEKRGKIMFAGDCLEFANEGKS